MHHQWNHWNHFSENMGYITTFKMFYHHHHHQLVLSVVDRFAMRNKKKYTVYNRVFFSPVKNFFFFFVRLFFILYSFCFILCHVSIQVFSYTFELFSNWTISKFNLFLLSLSLSLHTHRLKTWCSSNVFCFEFSWWIVFFYFFVVEMVPVTYYIRFVELKFPIGNSRFLVKYNRYTHTLLLSQWLDENFSTDIDNERKKTGKKEEKKISDEIKWLN